jgi:ribonuclease VapC
VKKAASLENAVVDSSALMSIFEKRSPALAFREALPRANKLYISAATLLELSVVFIGKKSAASTNELDSLLDFFHIEVVPFDASMISAAREGCLKFGRRHHKADLNFGDLFSYALAKNMKSPLYFEGRDFPEADIGDAMLILGYTFDEKHMRVPESEDS